MTIKQTRLASLLETAEAIEKFHFCGLSDDPDDQTAVIYGFKHLVKRFVGAARKIQNQEFQEELRTINTNIETLYEAYDLHSDIQPVIDQLRDLAEHPVEWSVTTGEFVDTSIIEQLRQTKSSKYDLTKVVRFCEELNSSFRAGNYLASTLLIRALMNHIPPIFGHGTFQQVVSQASKSRKELFKPLEEVARDVADLHTHALIRYRESLPTKNQIEPFRPSLEVLLQEIIAETQKADQTI
jgi:hypothetical protein